MRFSSYIFPVAIVCTLFLSSLSQEKNLPRHNLLRQAYLEADQLYRRSENLSEKPGHTIEEEEALTRETLKRFLQLLPEATRNGYDSLAFFCELKAGILYHYFDSLPQAMNCYLNAWNRYTPLRATELDDSFFFKPALFAGGIYFDRNQLDSALFFYREAEKIRDKYTTPLSESERLYNKLGAISYLSGNYSLARNYFEKAFAELSPANINFVPLRSTYLNNIATSSLKMEEYHKADSIYRLLLAGEANKNDILENLGMVNLYLGSATKALTYLQQVNYEDNRIIRLLNNKARALLAAGYRDSARTTLMKALAENEQRNGKRKNLQHGITRKYLGDLFAGDNQFNTALQHYQEALQQFYPSFRETGTDTNPSSFSGVFSYINLFETLISKAGVFEKKYPETKNQAELEAALQAYIAAFALADYVEKTYDSDEARLFLNKIKYNVHDKPIQVSLRLYELTGDKTYIHHAYQFDQQNKASILALNVKNNTIRLPEGRWRSLQEKATALKSDITRQSLKALSLTDTLALRETEAKIRDNEIVLSRISEELNTLPAYREQRFSAFIPGVQEVQQLLDKETALVSYHLSENECVALVITSATTGYSTIPLNKEVLASLDSFKLLLHQTEAGEKLTTGRLARRLYTAFISPVEKIAGPVTRLIIIPDDELHYLPFEALTNEKGEYLLEKFSVQYQYSTALLKRNESQKVINQQTLAFAPFTEKGFDNGSDRFPVLSASAEEVQSLKGKVFTDQSARRDVFFSEINKYGILHLATHAAVDENDPFRSMIAFYPDTGPDKTDRLYASEIYNLRLDSTDLVILSACETGMGKLVKGEGLMSLSRAFAYSGCPNIVTSLWKANDKSTAFITRRMHQYLDKGYTKDKALQQAKLDLLQSGEISPRLKSPNYWAHLVFIGNYTPAPSTRWWPWLTGIGIGIAGIIFFLLRKRKVRLS